MTLRHAKSPVQEPALDGAVQRILECQLWDGSIPWFEDGPWDPWNHAECVMALAVAGQVSEAWAGLEFLARTQRPDGAWLGEYGNALPMADRLTLSRVRTPVVSDSNFNAYPAVAVWRLHRLDPDLGAARVFWPMIRDALNAVLRLQHPDGDVSWCAEAHGTGVDDAVLAGCASIFKSLACGLALAEVAGEPQPHWRLAQLRLRRALLEAPHRFDRRQDRSAFAMDWYYPMLAGAMSPAAAWARLEARAPRFLERGLGCRCVSVEPWVTVAESCELALTLLGLGDRVRARALLGWQEAFRDDSGAYWMGWQFEEGIVWPRERPSWTQAAAILAHDALEQATPGWEVLVEPRCGAGS